MLVIKQSWCFMNATKTITSMPRCPLKWSNNSLQLPHRSTFYERETRLGALALSKWTWTRFLNQELQVSNNWIYSIKINKENSEWPAVSTLAESFSKAKWQHNTTHLDQDKVCFKRPCPHLKVLWYFVLSYFPVFFILCMTTFKSKKERCFIKATKAMEMI